MPRQTLPKNTEGFDLVCCGSGRWAKLVSPKVGKLHCIDPSSAIHVAKNNLANYQNCQFHQANVDNIPLANESMDFGYSLGVLHHIPDTQSAINSCVEKLKPGAPFLVYIYYNFDDKPIWFRTIWQFSNIFRIIISRLPYLVRYFVSQLIAILVYYPLVKFSYWMDKIGFDVNNIPLSIYKKSSFYTMRTDSLDRFGTRLEQRFSKLQIQSMLEKGGLENIIFSNNIPFWCAVGTRKSSRISIT